MSNRLLKLLLFVGSAFTVFCAANAAEVKADSARVIALEEAVHLALENDERIAIVEREVRVAGQEKSRALTIVSPRLDVLGQYQRPKEEIVSFGGSTVVPDQTWRGTIRVIQPILDTRVFPARRLGEELEAVAKENLTFTVRSVLLQVVRDYYNALRAREQISVSEQTLEHARKEVARAQARFKAGETRNTEVLRAEVDEAAAQRNLVKARNDYQLIISQLGRRLGISAQKPFEVVAPKEAAQQLPTALSDLYDMALKHRNDLAAARRQVRTIEERRNVTRNEWLPRLEVEYDHRFIDPESFASRNNFWEFFVVARVDLWDGGQRAVTLRQQREQIEQARLRVRELEKIIEVEVQQSLLDLRTLRENLKTLQKEVALAEENFKTLSEQARVGLATSLDVSTALNALDRAKTELTRQQFELEVAKRNLEAAVGVFAEEIVVKQK